MKKLFLVLTLLIVLCGCGNKYDDHSIDELMTEEEAQDMAEEIIKKINEPTIEERLEHIENHLKVIEDACNACNTKNNPPLTPSNNN